MIAPLRRRDDCQNCKSPELKSMIVCVIRPTYSVIHPQTRLWSRQSLARFGSEMAGHANNDCDSGVIPGKVSATQRCDSRNSKLVYWQLYQHHINPVSMYPNHTEAKTKNKKNHVHLHNIQEIPQRYLPLWSIPMYIPCDLCVLISAAQKSLVLVLILIALKH